LSSTTFTRNGGNWTRPYRRVADAQEYFIESDEAFIEDLHRSWLVTGRAAIEAVLRTKPEVYLKVIASLLPKDINLNVSPLDELSDLQLISRLREVTRQAAPILGCLIDHDPAEGCDFSSREAQHYLASADDQMNLDRASRAAGWTQLVSRSRPPIAD
jgi:hypothetical protein